MAKLLDKDMEAAEYRRQVFRATCIVGVTFDDMLSPEYWAHVAKRLNPYDIVEVVAEDGSFYARFIVLDKGKLWAKVQELEHVILGNGEKKVAGNEVEQFESKYFSRGSKWRIVRKSDGAVVANDMFENQAQADDWIEKNAKNMAA